MTSDTTTKKTKARKELDIAMGRGKVSLSTMSDNEVGELLESELFNVELRDLRGFKPLKDILNTRFNDSSFVGHMFLFQNVEFRLSKEIAPDFADGEGEMFEQYFLLLQSYFSPDNFNYFVKETGQKITRDELNKSYRESDVVLRSGTFSVLVLRRPRDRSPATKNLFHIYCSFEKVPLKQEYEIMEISIKKISIDDLVLCASMAMDVLGGVNSAYYKTQSELDSDAKRFRAMSDHWERLVRALRQ